MSTSVHARPVDSAADAQIARSLRRLYLIRAAISVFWAITLTTPGSSTYAVATGLLIFYPLLDVVASLVDARVNRGTGSATIQYVNAAISMVTAIAMSIAAGTSLAAMVAVFGIWASMSGLVQLFLAIRRRRQLSGQWAMIVSGGLSTGAGLNFIISVNSPNFAVTNLAGYAALGAVLFVITALQLTRTVRDGKTGRH